MKGLRLLSFAALGLSGCFVSVDHHHHQASDATLVVDWTVDDTKDPAQCRQGGATTIDIIVETGSGRQVGEYQADCEDFETSIYLPPGDYQANAVLLDSRGRDRTTSVQTDPVTLYENDYLTVPIDFPADSFL